MNHPINTLMICDKEEDRFILKSFLRQLQGVEIYEVYRLNKIDSVLEIIDELEIDIIFVDLRESSLGCVTSIKDKYKEIIIMLIDNFSQEEISEFNKDNDLIDAYIKKPILNYVFKFKAENLINLVKIERNATLFFKEKSAINLFSKDVRSMKIFYYITNEDDMMDFGGWFFDYYYEQTKTMTFKFHDLLDFLYKIISEILSKDSTTTVIIERSFEIAYINVVVPKHIKFKLKVIDEKLNLYKDNLSYKDGILSLKVKPDDDLKEERKDGKIIEVKQKRGDVIVKKDNNQEIERDKKEHFIKTEIQNKATKDVVYIDNHDKELLRKSYVNKVSAREFLNELDEDDAQTIEELIDLEKEWISIEELFESNEAIDNSNLHSLAVILRAYSSAIGTFYTFVGLSHALLSLSNIVNNVDVNLLDEKKVKKIFLFLNSLRSDLANWKINIFDDAITNDIHYLDSSLLSSCMNIESILSDTEIKDEESELELF